jgi:two-component system, sensor histidine kinase
MSQAAPTILNVNDDDPNREGFTRVLRRAGFRVREAADGAEALRLAALDPDLVFLDVQMPGLDGFEVCRRLKADPATAAIPVLMHAADFTQAADRAHGLEGGADGYLTLPVEPFELVACVRALLRVRRSEAAERAARERAEREVEVRRRAEEALKEADRRKDEFLATLAHELRGTLVPVVNSLAVLRLRGPADAGAARAREAIERQVKQLTGLVDDLFDLARIKQGKVKVRKEPVGLAEVVDQAVERVRPLVEARRHCLSVCLPPQPVRLEADPGRLTQVFQPAGQQRQVHRGGGSIWLTARPEGAVVEVRVRDSGVGIPAELLPRVFDLYAQADGALAHGQGGLGIGLALVKSLVGLHGGSVGADSAGPGQGSTFTVRLPLLPGPEGRRPMTPRGCRSTSSATTCSATGCSAWAPATWRSPPPGPGGRSSRSPTSCSWAPSWPASSGWWPCGPARTPT